MAGSETIKAEVQAIRDLRDAVGRYAEQLRAAMAGARRQAAVLTRKAEQVRAQRKAALDHARRDLARTQADLAGCRDERQVAALQRAANVASARAEEAQAAYSRAGQAVRIAEEVQSNLAKTVQALAAVVGQHASVAASILTTLDEKVDKIDVDGSASTRAAGAFRGLAVGMEVLMAAHNFTGIAGDVSQGRLPFTDRFTSTSQQQENYAESDVKWREDHPPDVEAVTLEKP